MFLVNTHLDENLAFRQAIDVCWNQRLVSACVYKLPCNAVGHMSRHDLSGLLF